MSGEAPATTGPTSGGPILDEDTRAFVRRCMASGVLKLDEIKTVVASLMVDDTKFTVERLAEGLEGAGLLTKWQSKKLLAGKSKGFFLGAYKLLRPLGKGGMGMVYLGEHHVMKRQMALKVLPPEALEDQRRIERFKEEARASAQLDHLNIVRAYDFNEAGKKLYIVMEYIDGIDLHQVVVRDGVMSVEAALDAVTQATAGLAHAHERGVIHRDIKPSNLMIRSDGVVKVSDMGLARIGWTEAGDADKAKRLMGTADFVAPEQALNSQTVDARADIYSLGCTLYFLLTGHPPFKGKTVAQRLAQHQTAAIPDIREERPDCPKAVANLLTRMLAKKPADRPASAAELLAQLERIRGGSGLSNSHRQLAEMATNDTSIDDKLYQATIDEQSGGAGALGEVIEDVEVLEEFDFDSLPAFDTMIGSGRSQPGLGSHPPVAGPRLSTAPPPKAKHSVADLREHYQMLILGIGLTIAVLALLLVVGVAAYTATRPLPSGPTKIKATEQGKSGVIIIGQ